jgi:threonine dehydratase
MQLLPPEPQRVTCKRRPRTATNSPCGTRWNISLFHYRNHGSDYGRVLAGIQVPPAERAEFMAHLNDLHYAFTDETANPAFRLFLGA